MKLVFSKLNEAIEWDEKEEVLSLVIEDKHFFFSFLEEIKEQYEQSLDLPLIISEDSVPVETRRVGLITDILGIDYDFKEIEKHIQSTIEHELKEDLEIRNKITTFTKSIIETFSYDSSVPIRWDDDVDLHLFSKLLQPIIEKDYENLSEKLIHIMELLQELKLKRVFILVGVHQYMTAEEFTVFLEMCLQKELSVICLETVENSSVNREKKVLLDEDFCVIY